MGFLKNIGKYASKAAPFTALIPGVGPLAAAGITAATRLAAKGKKAKLLKDVALPAAVTYGGANLLRNAGGIRGIGSRLLGRSGTAANPGTGGRGGGGGGLDISDLLKAAGLAGGGYAAYRGIQSSNEAGGQADELTNEFLTQARRSRELADERYASSSSLRDPAVAALKTRLSAGPRKLPDIGALYDAGNPFRKKFGGQPQAAAPPAQLPPPPIAPPAGAELLPPRGGMMSSLYSAQAALRPDGAPLGGLKNKVYSAQATLRPDGAPLGGLKNKVYSAQATLRPDQPRQFGPDGSLLKGELKRKLLPRPLAQVM